MQIPHLPNSCSWIIGQNALPQSTNILIILPSPSNLKRWRLMTESSCFLCRKSICTSAHILGACKIVLHQGRFSFRHDKVLCALVVIWKNFLSSYKPNKSCVINFINFVREGKKPKTAPSIGFLGGLHWASDWNLEFDLDGMLVVPVFLAVSTLSRYTTFFEVN